MILLLADENVARSIVTGVRRRAPGVRFERVQDVGLAHTPDPDILEWSAQQGWVVVTFDRDTFPGFAYERVRAGAAMSGVLVLDTSLSEGQAIEQILLVALAGTESDWVNQVLFLPL